MSFGKRSSTDIDELVAAWESEEAKRAPLPGMGFGKRSAELPGMAFGRK